MSAEAGLGPRVLRSSPVRTVVLLAVSILVLVIGVAVVATGEQGGWLAVIGGAVLTGFLVLLLVRPNRLELDDQGFSTVSSLGRATRVEWRECGAFRVQRPDIDGSFRAPLQVVYDTEESNRHNLAVVSQFVAGGSAALPDTYGMSAEDLADLLNRYRTSGTQRPTS